MNNYNTGGKNSGRFNSGDYNSGSSNTGYMNSGDFNTGDFNTGNSNSGCRNTGTFNTGNFNTGNFNTGDWNACSNSSGVFCTKESNIVLFDKPSDMTLAEWHSSEACKLLIMARTTVWIEARHMTKEEKQKNPEYLGNGGYLKRISLKEACAVLWERLSAYDRSVIKGIQNFDRTVFRRITGIDV